MIGRVLFWIGAVEFILVANSWWVLGADAGPASQAEGYGLAACTMLLGIGAAQRGE